MLIIVFVDDEESDLRDFRRDGSGDEVTGILDDGGDFDLVWDFWITDFSKVS